jgi:hypothetical protein
MQQIDNSTSPSWTNFRAPQIPCFHLHTVPQPCPIGYIAGFNLQALLLTNHDSLADFSSSQMRPAKPGIKSITSMCFHIFLGI